MLTCEPDAMVMGMSAETFWGGVDGSREFKAAPPEVCGHAPSTTGADACDRALKLFGATPDRHRHAVSAGGARTWTASSRESGYEVAAIEGLRCPHGGRHRARAGDRLREAMRAVDGPHVDAIVQVGTNLSMVRLADEAERWLGKPVIAINAATWWMALRYNGVATGWTDSARCCGSTESDVKSSSARGVIGVP